MTPVALLHGFTGSPRSFGSIAAELTARGFVVETPALVGHGAEDDAEVHDFMSEVERLARVFERRGGTRHLVGYSLGGRVAIGLLCEHPELFSSATLVSAQPGLADARAREERRAADAKWCELLESRGVAAFVTAWEALPLFASQANLPEALLDEQRSERLSHDGAALARSLRTCGLAEMPSYWDELERLEVPTTILVGERDAKFVGIGRRMSEKIAGSELVVVPGVGHNLVLERPAALLDAILRASRRTR